MQINAGKILTCFEEHNISSGKRIFGIIVFTIRQDATFNQEKASQGSYSLSAKLQSSRRRFVSTFYEIHPSIQVFKYSSKNGLMTLLINC